MKVQKYSHHFVVTGFDKEQKEHLNRYAMRYGEMGPVRVGPGKFVQKIVRVYAASTLDKVYFRFHINQLEEFLEYLRDKGVGPDKVEVVSALDYSAMPAEFVLKSWIEARDYQQVIIDEVTGPITNWLVPLQTGKGKAQPLDAFIRVPGGWRKMREMKVGMVVTAADGTPTKITGVFPQGKKEVYRITLSDGRSAVACGEHLWSTYQPSRSSSDWNVVDTNEMIRIMGLSNNRLYLPLPKAEDLPEQDLPLDPYALGVLIGDGNYSSSIGGNIQVSLPDDHIRDEFTRLLPEEVCLRHNSRYDYRITKVSSVPKEKNPLKTMLKSLGIYGSYSFEKKIPTNYMYGSIEQRLRLLQGLMDTDGTAEKSGNVYYCTSSKALAVQVTDLIRGLGGIARIRTHYPTYTHNGEKKKGREAYRVSMRYPNPPELFTLPRKKERVSINQYSKTLKLAVKKIEKIGEEECQCISIEHPDHLYITDNWVVTHNTNTFFQAAAKLGVRTAIVLKPMYIDKWIEDFKGAVEHKKGDLMVIRGTSALISYMNAALAGELDAKFYIFSNKTLSIYYKHLRDNNGDLGAYTLNPEELFSAAGIGLRGIDEVHQDFHMNWVMDCYTNVKRAINLSATFLTEQPLTQRLYKIMFPEKNRATVPEWEKYIIAKALIYGMREPTKVRYMNNALRSYSHVKLEQSLLKLKRMLKGYLDLIEDQVETSYIYRRKPDTKCLVFATTVDMCDVILERLQERWPDLDIRRYTSDDDYKNVQEADVVVSTIKSAGTAIDIPGLITVLMTDSVDSIQANVQALGRLRKPKDDMDVEFLYLVCRDIEKQMQYHERKKEKFKGKVLRHMTYVTRFEI